MEERTAPREDAPEVAPRRHKLGYRLVKSVVMVLGPIAMGLYLELVGPTLNDLQRRVSADYEQIGRALTCRGIGLVIGSFVSGFLSDKYADHVEMFVSGSFLLGAIGTLLMPWVQKLWLLGLMMLLQGAGEGGIDTNGCVLLLRLWGTRAAAPLHAFHFGYGIGGIIAAQLARPFISERPHNRTAVGERNQTSSLLQGGNGTSGQFAPIEVPYSVGGLITMLFCFFFLAFYIYDRFHEQKQKASRPTLTDVTRIFSPGSCVAGRMAFGIQIFLLIFLYYFNMVGGEWTFGKFIYSYAVESGNFSKDAGTALNSVFWFCFMTGRGVTIVIARWVSPKYHLPFEISCLVTSSVVMAVWGYSVPVVLWIFTGLTGLCIAPLFPGGLAWSNLYVEMSGMAVALVYIGTAAGGACYQWFTGYLFQYRGPSVLMYVMVGSSVLLSFIYILMTLLTCRAKQRMEVDTTPIRDNSEHRHIDHIHT